MKKKFTFLIVLFFFCSVLIMTLIHFKFASCPFHDARTYQNLCQLTPSDYTNLRSYLTSPLLHLIIRNSCHIVKNTGVFIIFLHISFVIYLFLYMAKNLSTHDSKLPSFFLLTLLLLLAYSVWIRLYLVLPFTLAWGFGAGAYSIFRHQRKKMAYNILGSLLFGLAVISHPILIFAVPFLITMSNKWYKKVSFLVVALFPLLLYGVWNWFTYGDFFIVRGSGYAFYVGNHVERPPVYEGFYAPGSRTESARILLSALRDVYDTEELTEAEADRKFFVLALKHISKHPVDFLKKQVLKFRLWLSAETYDPNISIQSHKPRFIPSLPFPVYFLIGMLSFIYMFFESEDGRRRALFLISVPVATLLTNQLYYFQSNFRDLSIPFYILLTFEALQGGFRFREVFRSTFRRYLLVIVLLLTVFGWTSRYHVENKEAQGLYEKYILARCQEQENLTLRLLREGLKRYPCYLPLYSVGLQEIYKKEGLESILSHLKHYIGSGCPPSDWISALLGDTYFRLGYLAEAREYLERAIQLNPWNASAHFALSQLYSTLGEPGKAHMHHQKYLEIMGKISNSSDTNK